MRSVAVFRDEAAVQLQFRVIGRIFHEDVRRERMYWSRDDRRWGPIGCGKFRIESDNVAVESFDFESAGFYRASL